MNNLTAAVLLAGVTFVSLSNAGSGAPADEDSARALPTTQAVPDTVAADPHQRFDHAR